MTCEVEDKQWSCGKVGVVNLQLVSSVVRDIGEPCLPQSPTKVSKMLKPEKWQASFDSDGKVFGFQKALKLIFTGGVDPSIRSEVWEFLLGCYELSSTADYRRQLRTARRERYDDLIKKCQMMHSSVGSGSLAYVLGSKVMDMRKSSGNGGRRESKVESREDPTDDTNNLENYCDWNINCTDMRNGCQSESSSDSAELASLRGSTESAVYDSSNFIPSSPHKSGSPTPGRGTDGSQYVTEIFYDFPPLPVTDLFKKKGQDLKEIEMHDDTFSTQHILKLEEGRMHSFHINHNIDLIKESNGSPSNVALPVNCEIEMVPLDVHETRSKNIVNKTELVNRLRISDLPETPNRGVVSDDRVSEWLWTLHQIVVDVVRTDTHLEFYENTRNLARMSDILAVYAWIDPATGYCQGMSDLLSPFVILFEDDADAFWCFEMLLRRLRANFQIEGPTGVMKQLQALWRILKLTDREIFAHLNHIGAESLHFAFRMLLVLFRRELSFNEALCMWEMMWAVDFDESVASKFGEHCLEELTVQLPRGSVTDAGEENIEDGEASSKAIHPKFRHQEGSNSENKGSNSENKGIRSASTHHFCGLTRSFLWSKSDHMHLGTTISSTRNGDNELPVFCVAAILILNRHKIIKETHSIDDMIKIFNDKMLTISVKKCVRMAIKLRKKYFYKLIRSKSTATQNGDSGSSNL